MVHCAWPACARRGPARRRRVRDLWLVGDRVTLDAGAGRATVADGGFILPGPGRRALPHRHRAGRRRRSPPSTQARALAIIDRDAGVLAIRDAGSPFPYPELDDDPDLPRLARAGRHVAPAKRYLRDIGRRGRRRTRCAARGRPAGRGRQRLGEAGRRLDRPRPSATSRPPGTPRRWPRR